jgi:hypothetical protein
VALLTVSLYTIVLLAGFRLTWVIAIIVYS